MKEISPSELSRLNEMSQFENRLRLEGYSQIAGIDEAGRGPLAGPVVAAACILPENIPFEHLNDSKLLTKEQRDLLFTQITTHPAVIFGIGIVEQAIIDKINILQATLLAMQKAVSALPTAPDYLLIDGNKKFFSTTPAETIIKGDSLSISIAAASVIAKVTRDRLMDELDAKWPQYGFSQHKGYGTKQHLETIALHGPCPAHRQSFEPIKSLSSKQLTQSTFF